MKIEIGNWVRRETIDNPSDPEEGKWHYVDSTVAGDVFTKCGRRMEVTTSDGTLVVSEVEPLTRMIGQPQLCQAGCS